MTRFANLLLSLLLLLSLSGPTFADPPLASAQEPPDLPLIGGRFYTQASGQEGTRLGFAVVDDERAPFWREFQRLGGPAIAGYPISRRFQLGGFETQAFQKLVFQWKPAENRLDFVNVFDLLADSGRDDWLLANKQVPRRGTFNEEGKPFETIQRERLALLDKNPALRAAYLGVAGDPITLNGLPTAEITEFSNVEVLRAQRVVFQYWKEAVPWAAARTVTVANGGDVAKEAGLFPDEANRPMTLVEATAPPGSASPTPGGATASATPASGAAPPPVAPPAGPSLNLAVGDSLKVEASVANARPPSGVPFNLSVRVTTNDGRSVQGAIVLVLVHYPLKSDDTTYATDGVFFSRTQTDVNGALTMPILLDRAIPTGVGATIEVSALYPPAAGRTEVSVVAG